MYERAHIATFWMAAFDRSHLGWVFVKLQRLNDSLRSGVLIRAFFSLSTAMTSAGEEVFTHQTLDCTDLSLLRSACGAESMA
jgi:hypothetical protein